MPGYEELPVKEVDPDKIRIVHHGSANADRLLGNMVELFKNLDDRFTLDLYLVGAAADINKLKQKAGNRKEINFHPIPFTQLLNVLNQYDIGLFFWELITFNIKHCLPNKLFELIQSRLIILSTPLPDISQLVNDHECGLILSSYDLNESARVINSLTAL
jgi:hypothetical protein